MACIKSGHVPGHHVYESEKKRQEEINHRLMNNDGTENPFLLWRELGDTMTKNCTVIRYNKNLQETDVKLVELLERYRHVNLSDRTDVGEHVVRIRPPALQHAATGTRDCPGRGTAR